MSLVIKSGTWITASSLMGCVGWAVREWVNIFTANHLHRLFRFFIRCRSWFYCQLFCCC